MGLVPFIGVLANIRGCGRFSSPLRKLRNRFLLPFIGGHSLREGAGNGWCHSTGYSLMSGVTGDFHRPYESSDIIASTVSIPGGAGHLPYGDRPNA